MIQIGIKMINSFYEEAVLVRDAFQIKKEKNSDNCQKGGRG